MSSARKPVIVRKLTLDWCAGYAAANLSGASPWGDSSEIDSTELELLLSSGKLLRIPWSQVKWVCYVREFGAGDSSGNDTVQPERLLRRRFAGRPRVAGIWLRITLSDGDELEGVATNDRSLVDGAGLLLTPPDTRSNTQRVFVPRGSIRELTVLGVISTPAVRRERAGLQTDLFSKGAFDKEENDQPAS